MSPCCCVGQSALPGIRGTTAKNTAGLSVKYLTNLIIYLPKSKCLFVEVMFHIYETIKLGKG